MRRIIHLLFLSLISWNIPAQPINILWITVEDMSPRLGCYGDSVALTPNIDQLAKESVRYTHAFSTYGVCAPSRHTLITGMYPTSTGAMAMRTWTRTSALAEITDTALLNIPTYEATPPEGVVCFTEYLRKAGYYCTNNSKTDYQFRPPVTAWDESSKYAHWRNRPDNNTPFFAVFNNTIPHESGIHQKRSPEITDPNSIIVPPYYPDTDTVRRDMARHYDNIHAMDQWVGEILVELKEADLLDKTIIFFYSDHGDGLPRAKRWVYDSGIHIPLLIRFPDLSGAGTTNDQLVSFVDFAPTILSLAGLEIPDYMEGLAFLGPKKAHPREFIYAFRDRMDPAPERIRAVRDHRFKYIRNYRADLPYIGYIPYRDRAPMMQEILEMIEQESLDEEQWQFWAMKKPLEELYDTYSDPHEIHNLASNPKYLLKLGDLRTVHENWVKNYGDLGELDEKVLIKKLWPPNGIQPQVASPSIHVSGDQITINSTTKGVSIAYRYEADKEWKLYYQSLTAVSGKTLYCQAFRIGWKASEIISESIK